MEQIINETNTNDYYVDKFVYVFDFETLNIVSVLHTIYPKFIYDIETKKIDWLEKIYNLNEDEESDLKLSLFEEVQIFISKNKVKIIIEDDTINNIK